ncbi:glutaredoxin family protein [Candidatus Acetothermia bacterium]|jgi:glutaredoxin-like YruB-family protein|nr:glutaredoxin family protein [Candidatus Acetothermia bacterium]MCI2426718.1 glutaredoxin family protein [Candidatus Acetothermia bacterium]MCI2427216.1 glutaredoxin family protein [Candidatus Acetothermia bacterium]
MKHNIIVYTTPTCSWCHAVKEYLNDHNVTFEEVDVAADMESAQEMIDKSGQYGVPVLDIDGTIVVGFDRAQIDRLLNL